MRHRRYWLALTLTAGVWLSGSVLAGPPADGPQLEPVPTARQSGSLPEPATWPALRYGRPLRLLVITDKRHSVAVYQRIARRMRSRLDVRYFDGHHASENRLTAMKEGTS